MPQIEWPEQPFQLGGSRPGPANFAPLPSSLAERTRKRGTYDRRWATFRVSLPPSNFDPSFHNAAPADQQAGNCLVGNETLILTNLHPQLPKLRTRMPGVRPRVGLLR